MNKGNLIASITAGLTLSVSPVNAEVMIGAFVPSNAWDQQQLVDLNASLPKSMAFVNVFSSFNESWDHLYWQSSNIVAQGMTPMISWMPIDWSRYSDNLLTEIVVQGSWDAYIDEWGDDLVAWVNSYPAGSQPSVMLRFGHEFNGNWYSYGDHPVLYQSAWQYIHDRFESAGVNEHIEWVWSANNVNVDSYNDITQYYPGDTYVDWTSIDGYNWGSNFTWTSWDSFTDVFSPVYSTLVTNYPDKPIVIAEVGSTEPADVPDPSWGQNGDNSDWNENKDNWTADMMAVIESDFPAIRAVSLFNIDKELSWSLTESTSTGLTGFNLGLASSHFTSEYLSSDPNLLMTSPTPGTTLQASDQFFSWNAQGENSLYIGTTVGANDIADTGNIGSSGSAYVVGLPVDGSTVYARLWTREIANTGPWEQTDYTFTAVNYNAGLTSPTQNIANIASADVNHERADAEVSFYEIPQSISDDTQWVEQMLAQVAALPDRLVTGAAVTVVGSGKSVKQEVKALVKAKSDIARLEAQAAKLKQKKNGSDKQLEKVRTELAKERSRLDSIEKRLQETRRLMSDSQANSQKNIIRKKIKKSDQQLRAVSKPLPPVNLTKHERMRNGFKSMKPAQREKFATSKRKAVE